MAALTEDRNTRVKGESYLNSFKLAAAEVFAGSLIAVTNATGYAAAAADTAATTVVGVAKEGVDNSAGAAGDESVKCGAGVYRFANDGTNPVAQSDVGQDCYVVDDQTVGSASTNSIVAGKVMGVDSDGVWVKVGL